VPMSFINAFCYLFSRAEIPPIVIQKTFAMCLDFKTSRGRTARGTTDDATQGLVAWLNEFDDKKFQVGAECLEGREVNFDREGKISSCLRKGGVALLTVKHSGTAWHRLLVLSDADAEWVYCFDSYPMKNRKGECDFEFFRPEAPHGANLRIKKSYLMTNSSKKKFRVGTLPERGCVLLNRSKA